VLLLFATLLFLLLLQEMDAALPARVKRQIAALKPQLYVVDARAVADSVGLGKRINMVMQTVFFQLSGVVPIAKVRPCDVRMLARKA
jgi:Pyruvate/2-oxoacid:ferredoxin oxidoreductase gamma subunit